MNLNELPAWSDIESQPWFAELTPEEKQQSLTKWQGDMMSFAKDPKEKFAVAATSKAKARSFFGEEMPDDPIADALQRRQKDLEDIGSRYDAFSKGELEEDDEEVLTLNDTLKGNTPYSVIKGRLFVSPQLVWDKAAYEKVVNEAPVDEDERVLAMSAYDGSKERAAEGVVNSLGYTDEAFRDFAAKGFKEGKSNAAILDEWKSNNKLPDGILGSLRGVGRQAYFGLRSGLSGLERAMGGLGGFFGSESAQKYAEESGKEAQSYMQRTLGEGPEFIGELTSGAVSIIPTIAAGAAASVISEGAALPAAASITAGAIQSAGATQAETYEFYRNQGLDHANALAESRVDGLVSGLITGAITHYAGKLGDKIGLGKGIEGLFSGPASKIASKLTQREISESLKAGAKAVGGSFLQEGSEELLDQAAQDAYSMIKRDPTLTLAEAINNALQAGKVGAVLGGAAEAGKIGLKSLLNSAKFAVPTTGEEEALRAKFEVPAAAEEEVIASPEVQQEEQNIKTAADVVKEAAPVAPQTAAVLAGIAEEKAGELAADVVGATEEVLADIEAEAPLVSPETTISPKPPVSPASETAPISETPAVTTAPLAPIPTEETQPPQGKPVEPPTNALPSLPREERPEMGLQQVGEGNAQPEKVATTRSEKEVGQDQQKFLSDLQFYGTARLGDNTFAIKQASDDSFYIEKTTGGQRSTVASGFLDIEAAQRGAAELVAPTPEEVASTGQPPTPVEEALPERGASVETIASGGGMSVEEARQFLARRSDSGEPLIFGRPFSEISGMQQNERPRVLQASDKLRAVKQVVGDINKFRIPVSQDVVNAYGITLPSGYVKQGDLYVFQTPSPPTTGAVPTKTLPAGQKVTPGGVASPAVEAAPEPAPEAQPEQPDAKEKAPTEPSESTLSIAKRFGGRIAWSQGDLAIIEGFQLFGSKSLYVAVVGDRYSLTDFTLMKPEQRKALLGDNEELFLRKREELVEANNRMLVQNPDGPFTNGQTVVVSKNVPQNVASVFREWVRLLGLSAPTRIVLTTPRDGIDMAAEYGGKFRRIGVTSLMSDNERGQMTPLGEDDFHIFYKEDTSYARTLEVLAHELGHILERQSFKNLPDDQRKAIIAEHEKWLKRVGSQKALDGIRELRAMRVGRIQPNVDRADDRFDSLNAYWKSFSEWFADQVARWATTTDKPLTVIEKFFARLGKKLREFFNLKGSQFAPNQRIADWLNSLSPDLNAVVEETLAPAEPAAKDSLPVVRDTSKPEQMTPLEYMRKAVGAKFVESVAPGKEEAWWSAKEKQEAPRRYAAGTKMVLEENGRFFVLDLNTNKYKGFGSKREAFLFFKAKDGRSERRYIEALSGKKLDPLSRIDHKIAVDNAVKNNAPVSAETVDAYGIKLPEGYVKQGELYVYEKTQPLPKDDTAGERGAVAPAPTVEPAPEAQPEQPVSQPVQAFRDAVSQMTPTAQAKWTPELRATAEAYLDSGGTTGLQGLSGVQQKVVGRFLPEEVKAAFDAEDARKRAQRNKLPDHRESSLPPTPGKQIRKIGKGAMESVPVVLDEIAKVIPNIRDLVEVRESVEGEPDAEGFYDPQADKAVVLVDNVYLKPQHGGSQEAALRETIVHELLHRGFAKLRQTNPQLFEQFEAYSLADTNDAQFEALVRRGYSMYSNWKDDPAQNQKAREEIFIRKAVVDLNFKGIEAIKSPSSLASQFFSWLRGLLNKLLGRKVDDETLLHWSRVFLNAAQADFIEKTPGERMHAFAGEKAIENLPEERRQFMRDSLDTAKAMAAAGKDSEEIRAVTGWFPGKYDGKMRWEVPDEGASWNFEGDVRGQTLPLPKVLNHPTLFSAYPELSKVLVRFGNTPEDLSGGSYLPAETNLRDAVEIFLEAGRLGPKGISTLLHEIQHAIQDIEGFARGGNVFSINQSSQEYQKRFFVSFAKKHLDRSKRLEDYYNSRDLIKKAGRLTDEEIGLLNREANAQANNYSHERDSELFNLFGSVWTDVSSAGSVRSALDEITNDLKDVSELRGLAETVLSNPTKGTAAALDTFIKGRGFSTTYQEAYKLVAGEIESRDVQARQNFTPEQRKATAPYSSENIAKEDAIVMFGGGAQMSLAPTEKYARHAELEAKHNAGTITPEETAEAQALVEEAAKGAGAIDPIAASVASTSDQDTGAYHYGDAGVGRDTVLSRMSGGRGTGHFGTGTYFLGKKSGGSRENRPVKYLDLTGLNLVKTNTPIDLHNGLRLVNKMVLRSERPEYTEPRHEGRKAVATIWTSLGAKKSEAEVQEAINKTYQLFETGKNDGVRTPSTYVMQFLGYDGVDARGTEADNGDYGSVVYPPLTDGYWHHGKDASDMTAVDLSKSGQQTNEGGGAFWVSSNQMTAKTYRTFGLPNVPSHKQVQPQSVLKDLEAMGESVNASKNYIFKRHDTGIIARKLNGTDKERQWSIVSEDMQDTEVKVSAWLSQNDYYPVSEDKTLLKLFVFYKNPLVADGGGKLKLEPWRGLTDKAKSDGNDAVVVKNTVDTRGTMTRDSGQKYIGTTVGVFNPSQIKSADPFTGVPLEQRFQPTSPDIRYSLADKDAEYLDAVEAGDMEKAQRMVEEAAKVAGYNVSGVGNGITYEVGDEPDSVYGERDNVMSHGGTFGFYFSGNPAVWNDYAKPRRKGERGRVNRTFLSLKNPFRFSEEFVSYNELQTLLRDGGITLPDEVKTRLDRLVAGGFGDTQPVWKWLHPTHVGAGASYGESLKKAFSDAGYDGVIHPDSSLMEGGLDTPATSYVVFSPEQIKSADPVTRDDAGNVIPLSQRFQTVSPDIRYSLGEPPDMQAEADALREVTPNSQALDKFRETFGTPRQDVGQVLGKKEGSVYTQAQVAPLSQHARNVIGFEVNEEGDPVVNPKATQKALDLVSKLLNTKGYASRFNTRAAKLFEGMPVDPEIASAVLVQELQAYANRLSASSPKAEDQILKAALTPFYNTVILGNYLTLRTAGRALQAAGRVSGTDDARKSREEAEKAVNKEITKQLGDEALPAAEGMDKAGVEGGVDAIKDDIPAPADPTLRLLDLAVESLDEVAKAKTERVFDILFEIGQLEELVAQDEKVGNKAMSILRNPNLAARNYPTDPAERKALLAQKKAELATALDEALASLQGAKPETKKKVKAKAAKTKSKTDSIQKLIDKLSKMPDESKEAKPKAETLRSAIADAIKEKEFDEQKVRDAATKFGATPEQTERLVEEAERIHEIRQSPKLSKAKLRQFLLSFPKNVLANPEQREALLRSFLKGQNYSEAEINRIVPQVLRDFDTGYQKARKAYLDELEKKLKPKQGQKESKQDQQNRKMLNALRSGLADTTSEASVALAKSLGFEAFRPQDDHILSKLDEEMRKLREQGRLSDSNAKFDAIKSLLIRRRPPRGFGEVVAQSWITSALSSLSNLAVNVWAPMGEAGVRLMSDIVRATALRKFDEIPLYFEAAGKAMKGTLSRFNFAVKTDTFTNSVNTLIAGMASMKDEMQRSAAVLKDKNASPAAKVNAGFRYVMSFGDYSRRILSSIDDTWYTALSSYVGSSNLIKLLGDAKMPKKVVEAIVFHANNDALNQARAEYETLQAVEQFIEAMRGKTNEEIDAGFEYLGLNDASVTKEQANYIQELVSAFQSLRLRSGATGDELIKRALKELRNFRASVSVRATELGQMRTKELVREALSDTQTPAQVEEAIKEFDENAKKAASFGMGLHRVEGVPPYDILGNMFGIVDAMGRQAVQKSPLLGRMIVGFFGIPLNLLNRAVWFTPYGLGRYFLAKWQMAKNPEEKFYEYSMASQRERTMRFTEAAVGTSMTMLLYALGVARDSDDKEDEGFYITLGGPSNKTEYDAWYARGFRKFSICYKTKSGSVVSVPYGRGTGEVLKGPLMLLGAFDDMRLNKKLGDREDMSSVIEYLNAAAAGIGKQATFLGAKNTAGAFFSEQFGTSTVSNLAYSAANLIPFNGLDRSISALALGPPDRSRTGAIWANIPIVRHLAHQPAINVFGDPWGNKSESALNQLWDRQWNLGLIPLNISAPLTGNQKRLYNFIGERLMGPSDPLRGALELRNGYLTDEEFYRYKQYRGKQMAHTWLTDLDRWRKLDDDSLSKAIAELSTKATKKAKDRFNYK